MALIWDTVQVMRTDVNRNPAAFTTDVAREAQLKLGIDYEVGSPFPPPSQLYTARLLGDPIDLTIKVIDKIGYYTRSGKPRWSYIAIPSFIWAGLSYEAKKDIVAFHYKNEGGTEMRSLFV